MGDKPKHDYKLENLFLPVVPSISKPELTNLGLRLVGYE